MTETRPAIEVAGTEDVAALAALAASTFIDTYAVYNTPEDMKLYLDEHFTPARIAAEMAKDGSCFLLMRVLDVLVGYAGLRTGDPEISLSVAPCWELERFYVVRARHGQGLAPPLMEACCEEARLRGFAGLWLGVWTENRRALRFYQKMGFRDEGEKTFVLGDDVQKDRVLVLSLTEPAPL